MYRVKYWNSRACKHTYRRYKNVDEYQLRRIVDNYSKRHGLVCISVTKEY